MTVSILDETPHFLVVSKPIGISVHGEADGESLTRVLRDQWQRSDIFPCHRLDKATSGAMLFAKGEWANRELSKMFASRSIEKCYLALSQKKSTKKQGTVKGDMVKARNGCWMLTRTQHAPAVTQFFSQGGIGGLRLFIVRPLTGKTHQIRVALKSIGAPILGDDRYHGGAADRCYLHAYALRFRLDGELYHYLDTPSSGEAFQSTAFENAISELQEPLDLPWPKCRV